MNTHKLLTLILAFCALIFLQITSQCFIFFHIPLVKSGMKTAIKVYPSTTIQTVSEQLYQQQLIKNPHFFSLIFTATNQSLRFGEYQIQYPMTAWTLLKHMESGTGLVKHRLTIVEGWTFDDIRTVLAADNNLEQTLTTEKNVAVMNQLGAGNINAEGLFYPDTYFFTWGNTDLSVLKTAYLKMQKILDLAWNNRAPNLPYQNAYQALIAASLIEKETAIAAEKPLISSVIINRLAKNMRLQIDPAVQYGAEKNFTNVITKKELKTKTPYNTYLNAGLPPTPICMPSESSILAALHPATTDYLFYVATGTGGHNFSASYVEHEQQVAVYRKSVSVSDTEAKR